MIAPRWVASPLVGTVGVLVGLGLLAIPLRNLTSEEPPQVPIRVPDDSTSTKIPAVLRLKLLVAAKRIVVKTAQGETLLDQQDMAAGEFEYDTLIPFADGELELAVEADLGAAGSDSALFLTVMPDGYGSATRYMIGHGRIEDFMNFTWQTQ